MHDLIANRFRVCADVQDKSKKHELHSSCHAADSAVIISAATQSAGFEYKNDDWNLINDQNLQQNAAADLDSQQTGNNKIENLLGIARLERNHFLQIDNGLIVGYLQHLSQAKADNCLGTPDCVLCYASDLLLARGFLYSATAFPFVIPFCLAKEKEIGKELLSEQEGNYKHV